MRNVKYEVKGNTLHIEVALDGDLGPSASGKTKLIASSSGNQEIPGFPGVKVGVTAFGPLPKKA